MEVESQIPVYSPHFTWVGNSPGNPPAQAQAHAQDPVSHPDPGPDPSWLIWQPASMLTSTGDEDTELVTSIEEDDIEREGQERSDFMTARGIQERTDEIDAAAEAELEEERHARLDEEDEAKPMLCMACEVPACMNVLNGTRDKSVQAALPECTSAYDARLPIMRDGLHVHACAAERGSQEDKVQDHLQHSQCSPAEHGCAR